MALFDRYVGLPFLDHGRSLVGLDCWGLVCLVYRDLRGIELPSYGADYVSAADRAEIAALIAGELAPWQEVPAGEEMPFDGVLMREGKFPRHVGLVTQPGKLLHVDRGETSRIEPYRFGFLSHRVVKFYRYRAGLN